MGLLFVKTEFQPSHLCPFPYMWMPPHTSVYSKWRITNLLWSSTMWISAPPLVSGYTPYESHVLHWLGISLSLNIHCCCSAGDLASVPGKSARRHPSGSSLERRHTIVVDHQSPVRSQYNYVPYSKASGWSGNSPHHMAPRQYSSDIHLNKPHPLSAAPPEMVRVPSGGVPPPARLVKSHDVHYQVPHTKPMPNYHSPLPDSYQVPTKKPPVRGDVHYQVPQSQSNIPRAGNPVPYAVVGVGSHNDSQTSRPREVVEHIAYDSLTPHSQTHRQRGSMSPVREPSAEVSPSHSQSKVAPIPIQPHRQQAFDGQASYDTLDGTNKARDSLASHSSTSVSTQDHLTEVMDVMDKALEQFDSLLQSSQEQKQIIQTSL